MSMYFDFSLRHRRMGLGPETLPYQGIKAHITHARLITLHGNTFPWCWLSECSLFPLSRHINGPDHSLSLQEFLLQVVGRELPSLWHKRDIYRPLAVYCPSGPTDHGGPTLITKVDLALALFHLSKVCSTQCMTVLFSLVTLIQICRRQKCGLLVLMSSTVRIFAILHVGGSSSGAGNWYLVFRFTQKLAGDLISMSCPLCLVGPAHP